MSEVTMYGEVKIAHFTLKVARDGPTLVGTVYVARWATGVPLSKETATSLGPQQGPMRRPTVWS